MSVPKGTDYRTDRDRVDTVLKPYRLLWREKVIRNERPFESFYVDQVWGRLVFGFERVNVYYKTVLRMIQDRECLTHYTLEVSNFLFTGREGHGTPT